MKTVLITGVSSGIGQALSKEYLKQGYRVYGIGRNPDKFNMSNPNFHFWAMNLQEADFVRSEATGFVSDRFFDLVILNAGIYPPAQNMTDTTLEDLRGAMDMNLWSNKQLIDTVLINAKARQIVVMGASPSVFEHKGFGAYAISKAALNTLVVLYAQEYPHTHFSVLAPELIHTTTFSLFVKSSNHERFPSIRRIRDRHMLPIGQAVPRLIVAIQGALKLQSGTFIEMKRISRQG